MHNDHEDKPFTLEVNQRCHECDLVESDFEPIYQKAITILKKDKDLAKKMHGGVVKTFFVSDEEIQQLNRNYRDQDKPTDVILLSYFEESPFPGEDMIGEIFISTDTANKQAKEHGISAKEESMYLFIHGLLHIFGYDHQTKYDRKRMYALQDEIVGHDKWRVIAEDDE